MRRTCFVVLVSSLIPAMARGVAAQTPTQLAAPGYTQAANGAPRSVVVADFNGDGVEDIALGGTGRDSVMVLYDGLEPDDNGNEYSTRDEIVVGGGPFELAVGDLNRDGLPDIAVANADLNAVTILLNAGFPGRYFMTPVKIDVPVAQNPRGLAVADINRDGKLDIVVTKFQGTTVEVLFGAGDGTFPTRRSHTAPSASQGVAVADFDNNGWMDFVVASSSRLAYYFNSAGGTTRSDIASTTPWNVVTTGDLDEDGDIDVAAASTAQSVARIFYRGGGSSALISTASSPRGIEAGDLNRDGTLELVLAGRASSTVSVLTRQAGGSYTNTEFAAGPGARDVALFSGATGVVTANEFGNSFTILGNVTSLRPPAFAFEPLTHDRLVTVFATADVNHNGILDYVTPNWIVIDMATFTSIPHGQFDSPEAAAVGDFNRDGHPDVVYAIVQGLKTFLGNGAGGFTAGPVSTMSGAGSVLKTADMNQDGITDLVMAVGLNESFAIEVWRGTGTGSFTRIYRADTFRVNALDVADLDGNGTIDVAATSRNGLLTLLFDRTGTAATPKWFDEGTPKFGLAIGRLNWDARPDVVVVEGRTIPEFDVETPRPLLTVALGTGDGTFRLDNQYAVDMPDFPNQGPRDLALGDLNHDGGLDVITGLGALLFGDSNGGFFEPKWFGVGAFGRGATLTIADANDDGLNDVVGMLQRGGEGREIVMLNTLRLPSENRPPTGITLPARGERPYADFFDSDDQFEIFAGAVFDPDLHWVRSTWTDENGSVLSRDTVVNPNLGTGTHQLTYTADDMRGGTASASMEFVITPHKETVIWARDAEMHGTWRRVDDATAAGNARAHDPNANAPKLNAPLANPANYIELPFLADRTQVYKLWIRLKADNNFWGNDSVWVQFTGAKDANGNTLYGIGTTSGLAVNLEECSGCGISGWGWEDDGWGAVNRNGVLLHFPEGGVQRIRIQTREDGVSIDQIVLSAERFKTARPGTAKNDTTKLTPSGPGF